MLDRTNVLGGIWSTALALRSLRYPRKWRAGDTHEHSKQPGTSSTDYCTCKLRSRHSSHHASSNLGARLLSIHIQTSVDSMAGLAGLAGLAGQCQILLEPWRPSETQESTELIDASLYVFSCDFSCGLARCLQCCCLHMSTLHSQDYQDIEKHQKISNACVQVLHKFHQVSLCHKFNVEHVAVACPTSV